MPVMVKTASLPSQIGPLATTVGADTGDPFIIMNCVTSVSLPQSSVTLYVRVIVSGQLFPSDTSDTKATVGFIEQLSTASVITDISGTAFTFAYATGKPVIFFSKMENSLDDLGFSKLDYFQDRNKVGVVAKTVNEILPLVKKLSLIEKEIKETNKNLLEQIDYLGRSHKRIKEIIDLILSKNYTDIN